MKREGPLAAIHERGEGVEQLRVHRLPQRGAGERLARDELVGDRDVVRSVDAGEGGEVASVSVLAPNCMWADAWATALLVLGDTAGLALAQRLGLQALWLLRRGSGWVELGLGRWAS